MSGKQMTESLLRWRLNGLPQPALLCSPGEEAALLAGRLLTRGRRPLRVERAGDIWQAEAAPDPGLPEDLNERLEALQKVRSPLTVSRAYLEDLMAALSARDSRDGCHGALIAWKDQRAWGRDIGRHNALDKAVGLAASQGWEPGCAVLCTTGRLSLELLLKAAAVGIPVLCTGKHVGTLCVRQAEMLGIAVYQAGATPAVYGANWRIEEEQP